MNLQCGKCSVCVCDDSSDNTHTHTHTHIYRSTFTSNTPMTSTCGGDIQEYCKIFKEGLNRQVQCRCSVVVVLVVLQFSVSVNMTILTPLPLPLQNVIKKIIPPTHTQIPRNSNKSLLYTYFKSCLFRIVQIIFANGKYQLYS